MLNEKLIEFNNYIRGKKVAVLGIGVSNIPLIDYLYKHASIVTLFDKKEEEKIDKVVINKIKDYGMKLSLGENYLEKLTGFDIIFRSPSMRPDTPEIVKELERGAILTSEIELVIEMCPGTVIGVTGSDGKTTTTSLIYEILKENGKKCYLGGNIGIPLFTKIEEMDEETYVVLELSSFQLMTMKVSPKISVITNITPNHLDIHKSYDEYIEAKANIFKYQDEEGLLVVNYDNEITRNLAKKANGKVIYFSSKEKIENGIIVDDRIIKKAEDGLRRHILNTKNMVLRGMHNFENACAAIGATSSIVDIENQAKAIKDFKGVEHRLEFIRKIDNIKWYNDSIGSSPTRTIAGLNAFDEKIVLIAGGYDKHLDYTPIAKPIVEKVSSLILIGQTADKIEKAVRDELKAQRKTMNIYRVNTLEETAKVARDVAKLGEIVLFSPASASFDMFKDFMERGNKFKKIVQEM